MISPRAEQSRAHTEQEQNSHLVNAECFAASRMTATGGAEPRPYRVGAKQSSCKQLFGFPYNNSFEVIIS
ncbi:MAG: hypothetical protein RR576_05535 [Oscillospiraceae bacterium]